VFPGRTRGERVDGLAVILLDLAQAVGAMIAENGEVRFVYVLGDERLRPWRSER
jgi:hypothetical protein